MGQIIDLTGQKFSRLLVTGLSHQIGSRVYWDCVCDCGALRKIWGADLKRGNTLSCGCLMRDQKRARWHKHGMTNHPAHRSWIHARSRCNDPANDMYHLYGGRGIRFCATWDDFAAFWRDMGSTWREGLTLDRIETNGDYAPGNCRWATPLEQALNRRNNRIIETPAGPLPVTQAAERFGINTATLFARIRNGWLEADLLKPVDTRKRKKHT